MKEVWKDIKGYEGICQVSNLGNVINIKTNKTFTKTDNGYYLKVNLCKLGIKKQYYLHRLVAQAFIPNPKNKRTVNHKNGIRTDNRVENLEWATYKENVQHAIKTGLWDLRLIKVRCVETNIVYKSALDASRLLNICSGSICACCRKMKHHGLIVKTAGGYHWVYHKIGDIQTNE